MGLLAPLFLALGAIALAIPIVVHLIHRERSETVSFPSLMFLQRIPYRSVRRQKIRHWSLFLLRCLALLLLAAAFSRPFFQRDQGVVAGMTGAREIVVLLDRSYSMGYGDNWSRAVTAARAALSDVRSGDRATLILFADDAAAANRSTDERPALMAALDTVRPGSGVTHFAPALKLARQILQQSTLPQREAVLISDFQRAGWDPDEAGRLPPGTDFRYHSVAATDPANLTVAGASFQRDFADGRERVRISARVVNKGGAPVRGLSAALEVGGREVQRQSVNLPADGAASVAFSPVTLPQGVSRGTVRLADDRLPADNAFHFTLTPGQAISVLLLDAAQASTERSLFLRRALGVSQQPPFRLEARRGAQLTSADLNGRSVVISNDAGLPGGQAGRQLAAFVAGGGGLVVTLGERTAAGAFGAEAASLLPGRVGPVVDRAGRAGGRLTQVDRSHPVFEPFSAPRSGDFSAARFFRYRQVEVTTETAAQRQSPCPSTTPDGTAASGAAVPPCRHAAVVLARFDDGSPALVEQRIGNGTVLLWASTLDNFWSDFAVQPVYLPFVHQLVRRAAGYADAPAWFTVGRAVDLTDRRLVGSADRRAELVAVAPSGGRVLVPEGATQALTLTEQGFYEVRRPGEAPGSGRLVAANLDLSESDLAALDPEELAAAVRPLSGPGPAGSGPAAADATAQERERRQAVWWYLLVAAFIALAAETLLANRLSRTAAHA